MKRYLKSLAAYTSVFVMTACSQNTMVGDAVRSFVVSVNGVDIEMVEVQGGTFLMGCTHEQGKDCEENEMPVHEEQVADFCIGKYEVTQQLWNAVMGNSTNNSYNQGNDLCPVENVSWKSATEFIDRLNALTGRKFRLPTEIEWEYAARGGMWSKGYKYSGSNSIDEVAWYLENYQQENDTPMKTTHPVGLKRPNELGIYDMSGNVWEWCDNLYDKEYKVNGKTIHPGWPYPGNQPLFRRVLRGGSWGGTAKGCRVSYIDFDTEDYDDEFGGLRLALDIEAYPPKADLDVKWQ